MKDAGFVTHGAITFGSITKTKTATRKKRRNKNTHESKSSELGRRTGPKAGAKRECQMDQENPSIVPPLALVSNAASKMVVKEPV